MDLSQILPTIKNESRLLEVLKLSHKKEENTHSKLQETF